MSEKYREQAEIISQEQIGTGIFSMWLQTDRIAHAAAPGQFISVYSRDKSRMLPRPISICEAEADTGKLRIVYRVAGRRDRGIFPLRSRGPAGYLRPAWERLPSGENGGRKASSSHRRRYRHSAHGAAGKALPAAEQKQIVLGFRDEQFLTKELQREGTLYMATEDGSAGTKGNVLDCIRENGLKADVIFACGPTPMLRALKLTLRNRIQSAGCLWKRGWPAASEPAWPACANRKK